MDAAHLIRSARGRAGLSLRQLAERASTSHATVVAYEQGRVTPRVDTLERILAAAGFALDAGLARRRVDGVGGPGTKGEELAAVLELAGHFPARHRAALAFPVFGRLGPSA